MNKICIAIPTYRRRALLQATLDAMVAEDIHRMPGVEIMVRDNDSPDDTFAMLADYKARFNLQVSRNPRNQGMNENIGGLLKSCTADYMVLSSDEDPVRRSALEALQALLQRNGFAFASTVFKLGPGSQRGFLQAAARIPPQHFHLASFYISGLVFNVGLAQACWREIEPFLYDPRNIYPQTYLCKLLMARYGCYYLPLELAYMLNAAETTDLGEYWLPEARMAQNDLRREFLGSMLAQPLPEAQRAVFEAMAAVQVYR